MTAVLRVSGEQLDLERCFTWLPATRMDSFWRVGEKRPLRKKIEATSGFTVLLSESDNSSCAVEEVAQAFRPLAERVGELVLAGASASVDFALFVEANQSRSIKVNPDLAGLFSRVGVAIAVSAYPCR